MWVPGPMTALSRLKIPPGIQRAESHDLTESHSSCAQARDAAGAQETHGGGGTRGCVGGVGSLDPREQEEFKSQMNLPTLLMGA